MAGIYLDNAATSHPKPPGVYDALGGILRERPGNPGRGNHKLAHQASAYVYSVRAKAAAFLGIQNPEDLIFSGSATESINLAIKGWLRPGDRCIVSPVEHLAVMRPLRRLEDQGLELSTLEATACGKVKLASLEKALERPARLVIMSAANNVSGALNDVAAAARICQAADTELLVDAAQIAGSIAIDCHGLGVAMLALPAHKGLLAAPGLGMLYLRPGLELLPLVEGSGGPATDRLQTDVRPDRYEAGTLNVPGIAALDASLDYIAARGIESIRQHEVQRCEEIRAIVTQIEGHKLFCPDSANDAAALVSFRISGMDTSELGIALSERDVYLRTGLHCAADAHIAIGAFPQGALRASPGPFTTSEEVAEFGEILKRTVKELRR